MDKTRLDRLTLAQVAQHPLWKFVPAPKPDRVAWVAPDAACRPATLKNRVVATELQLADGTRLGALLENIDVDLPEFTRHWLVVHLRVDARWWRLARYHDADAAKRSPQVLAERLRKPVNAVFPMRYDVSAVCATDSLALAGVIEAEPPVRLKRAEIIRMAVPVRTPKPRTDP
ncbi:MULTISPECIES: hypothetical protein [unclassified Rhizobacter]|uniref:hypothetical protein n=1 Tax=unclassified Rhizobacter TaxID=2640088 RepID=UPI0007003300|nr:MULTISPECIES: hypothetical protein [unclassified Rhizobacter]KQU73430.1 hypothetical protein ASC88_04240 [Rhizobacter sp. Root29]KQV98615.1 hypothetical protein ASC98_08070 [Rhizobacter sp. Root1238]KRB04868.1 hypothetical protein ASE08_13225 [Rhizobacter sp. Root16D2]